MSSTFDFKYPALAELTKAASDTYTTEVELSVYGPQGDFEFPGKIKIEWDLELEGRSWGIKSMTPLLLTKKVELDYSEMTEDKDIDHSATLDISGVDQQNEYQPSEGGGQFFPIFMQLDLKGNPSDPDSLVCEGVTITWQT